MPVADFARPSKRALIEQHLVAYWIETRFGKAVLANTIERVARVVEETIELAQAEGMSRDYVLRIVDAVFARPPGEPTQEAAGVAVTLLGYAASRGFSLREAEGIEIERIFSKSPDHFRKRQAEKAALGISMPPEMLETDNG